MNLRIKLTIKFDDDEGTIIDRVVWVKNLKPIPPTHATVHAVIEEARA